jgi:hypothetical protein
MKKQIIIVAFTFVLLTFLGTSAKASVNTSATLPAKTLPCHIIHGTLSIQNIGNQNLSLLRRPNAFRTIVSVRDATNGSRVYHGYVDVSRSSVEEQIDTPPGVLPSGATLTYSFFLRTRWIQNRAAGPMFERPGRYRVQFEIELGYYVGGDGKLVKAQSNSMSVTVEDPPRKESRALTKLIAMPNRGWLFEPQEMPSMNSIAKLKNWEADLAKFVRENPKSYWAPHAHVAMAHVYEYWARETKSTSKIAAQWSAKAKRSVELGLGTTNPVSAGAARNLLLGRESNDTPAKPETVKPTPIQPNPFTAAQRELELEYYDLRSLSTNRAPWAREMKRRAMEILDKGMLGQMPLDEARRQAGELTKTLVRKHSKPLSKTEWYRRYKIYAAQDVAREARRRAIQVKNAPEDARFLKEAIEKRRQQEKPK